MFDKIKQQLATSSAPATSSSVNPANAGLGALREQVSKYASKYASSTASGSEYGASSQPVNEYIEPLDAYDPSQCHIAEFTSPELRRDKRGRDNDGTRALLKVDTDSDVDSPSHDHIQM